MTKKPSELREKKTGYDFLRFWDPSKYEECFEEDGGSAPRVRYLDNLRGVYVVSSHWMCRGNSLKGVKLRDLISYIQNETDNLKEVPEKDTPDMLIVDWLKELYSGNKKLRKNIGLDKIDIFQGTFVQLQMKELLQVKKSKIESMISKIR